jgi:hypothetical protein
MTSHPLRCRCGALQGEVELSRTATRAICYCRDCQAYGRFLGGAVLDGSGGTEVVAMHPRNARFLAGLDSMACLSLSPRGILRWYARCCRTPIGNTTRNRRVAYLGLVHACLGDAEARRESFGPVRLVANRRSALGPAASAGPVSSVLALANLGTGVLGARLTGSYRHSPFFDDTGEPVRVPYVLSLEERAQAYGPVIDR